MQICDCFWNVFCAFFLFLSFECVPLITFSWKRKFISHVYLSFIKHLPIRFNRSILIILSVYSESIYIFFCFTVLSITTFRFQFMLSLIFNNITNVLMLTKTKIITTLIYCMVSRNFVCFFFSFLFYSILFLLFFLNKWR